MGSAADTGRGSARHAQSQSKGTTGSSRRQSGGCPRQIPRRPPTIVLVAILRKRQYTKRWKGRIGGPMPPQLGTSIFKPTVPHHNCQLEAVTGKKIHREMSFEQCTLRPFPTVVELSTSLGAFVVEKATAAIAERGRFVLAVSGGSVVEVRCAQGCCFRPPPWFCWVFGGSSTPPPPPPPPRPPAPHSLSHPTFFPS